MRGKATIINNYKVTRETKVENLMPLRVTNIIPQPNNRADNPSREILLKQTNLVLVAEFLAIILMNVPFYLKFIRYGKLKQLLLEYFSP